MENSIISCIQCGMDFEFTVEEQQRFQRKGFDAPRRCPDCRRNKYKDSEQQEKRKFKDKKKHYRFKFNDGFDD